MTGEWSIDETSALYRNFLLQMTALNLPSLAEEIVLAHLHAAMRTAARAKSETPKFRCRESSIYLRVTGDARTAQSGIPSLLIAYRLNEEHEQELLIEPVLVDLLSRHESGDVDPLLPPEMVETLLDYVSLTGEAPESLMRAVEQILDDLLGDSGN